VHRFGTLAVNCHWGEGRLFHFRDVHALRDLYALVDFLAVHSDVLRRIDTRAHLVAFDTQNRDGHVVTNDDGLADTSSKNQHSRALPWLF
jgi:hypothetical protein